MTRQHVSTGKEPLNSLVASFTCVCMYVGMTAHSSLLGKESTEGPQWSELWSFSHLVFFSPLVEIIELCFSTRSDTRLEEQWPDNSLDKNALIEGKVKGQRIT